MFRIISDVFLNRVIVYLILNTLVLLRTVATLVPADHKLIFTNNGRFKSSLEAEKLSSEEKRPS